MTLSELSQLCPKLAHLLYRNTTLPERNAILDELARLLLHRDTSKTQQMPAVQSIASPWAGITYPDGD